MDFSFFGFVCIEVIIFSGKIDWVGSGVGVGVDCNEVDDAGLKGVLMDNA